MADLLGREDPAEHCPAASPAVGAYSRGAGGDPAQQAQRPDWNCLHDLARMDRHRELPLVTLYWAWANAKLDLNQIADFASRIGGVIQDNGVVATFRWLGEERELTQERFDFNVEFEIELANVAEVRRLTSEQPQRPWGPLDRRLQMLHRAVVEYAVGLEAIAREEAAARVGR